MAGTFTYDDGTGLAFLQGQLSYIESKLYEKKYKEITYPQIIPISNEAGEWATSITYYFMDGRTIGEFVGSKTLDTPIAEVGTKEVIVKIELGAIGYEYSHEELRQAIYLNRPLTDMKASACRRGYEEHAQRVSMFGDTEHNLPGFLNNTNVTAATVVNPGSGTEWVNKSPDEILFDINDFMGDIYVDTLQVESANKLLLPTAQWNLLSTTYRATNSDMTLLKALVSSSPYLTSEADVIATPELTGAGAGGTDRMMAYDMNIEKVVFHIPMPLKFYPPQNKGRGFEIPAEYKLSGVEFRYPGSARYADGI